MLAVSALVEGRIGELIFKLHGVRFTEPGVGKYLKRWGLTFQRPDKRAVEQDPEAVRIWREETWSAIRARGRRNPPVLPPPTTPTSHRARILRRRTRPLPHRRVNLMSF
ncbi:helix-turn-helix domain-containing protein [Streptomyces wuyuanensis]|uniref:helix-turn-helix domain-containing protein n=1 Tax=Streptomyces wuyuanensis TaxID=1196353 RepID=UPI003F4CE879